MYSISTLKINGGKKKKRRRKALALIKSNCFSGSERCILFSTHNYKWIFTGIPKALLANESACCPRLLTVLLMLKPMMAHLHMLSLVPTIVTDDTFLMGDSEEECKM